jgi:PAS domain S-box-containing protein
VFEGRPHLPVTDTLRLVVIGAGVTVAYVVSALAGFTLATVAEQVTTVWAPTGIAQAALILYGRRLWPGVFAGAFLANSVSDAPLWTAAAIATGNTLEAVAVSTWLSRTVFDPVFGRLADAARFIVAGAVVCTTISATIGVVTLCAAGLQPWDRAAALWSAWWVGDALGALVVAPLLLTLARSSRRRAGRARLAAALVGAASVAVTAAVFGELASGGPLHYVLFPLVIVAAVRFGQPATSLAVFGAAATAIVYTARGLGPFALADLNQSLILLQVFMGVIAGTGLLLAAALSERATTQRRLGAAFAVGEVLSDASSLAEASPAMLRRICERLEWQFGAIWLVDPDGRELRCLAAWGEDDEAIAAFKAATERYTFARGRGLPGRVWDAGQPVWIEDVVQDRNFPRAPIARAAGLHGGFAFPVRVGSDVLGVIEFFTHRVAARDRELLEAMSTIGTQVGQFVWRTRAEAASTDEQAYTRAVLDTALDAVIAMDHRGVITAFNPAAERMFGRRQDEVLRQELADVIIPPDLRAAHRAGLARYLATGEGPFLNRRVETRGVHADGREFPIEVSITTRTRHDGPPRFTGFVRDLTAQVQADTERREAMSALRLSEERFRALAASSTALTMYEHDRDLRYTWVFPQHPEFSAHNIGKTDAELLPTEEGERLMRLKREVLESGSGRRVEITVTLGTGTRYYDLMVEPRRDAGGAIVGVGGVAVDITERKHHERLLQSSQAQLRETDRRKDEFLAMLAHELRNPLAPIRTGLRALHLAGHDREAVDRIRPMMERQVAHMVRLIDDLLDVSRITSGKIHLQKEPAQLADLVHAAVDATRAALDESGARLAIELPAAPVWLTVDATRFVQVITNLLHNAAKFTGAGDRVTIAAMVAGEGAGAWLHLTVRDTGTGIDAALLPHVFELFTQGGVHRRGTGGLGIGLALARRIVEMHGGDIEVESDGPGLGSAFTVRLPVGAGARPPAPAAAAEAGRQTLAGRRVLVVDDNADNAETVTWLVRSLGGQARSAGDGAAALVAATEFQPDVVLLDIGMPGMDGYETCRRLRQQSGGRPLTIVALTGWGQDRDKQRAREAGFDAHLTKPADPAQIERLLSGHQPEPRGG